MWIVFIPVHYRYGNTIHHHCLPFQPINKWLYFQLLCKIVKLLLCRGHNKNANTHGEWMANGRSRMVDSEVWRVCSIGLSLLVEIEIERQRSNAQMAQRNERWREREIEKKGRYDVLTDYLAPSFPPYHTMLLPPYIYIYCQRYPWKLVQCSLIFIPLHISHSATTKCRSTLPYCTRTHLW